MSKKSAGGRAQCRAKAANENLRDEAELWGYRQGLIRQERGTILQKTAGSWQ